MPPGHALSNLQSMHLKISRFSQCNDPFELASFNMKNREIRRQHREWLNYMDSCFGLLCFSRSWRNPVMWSHYAKDHTGVCFAFDVNPKIFVDVRYVSERLYPNLSPKTFFEHVSEEQMVDLFATKFIHWGYEEEVRLLVRFSETVSHQEFLFHDFSEDMQLRQVIVGPKSELTVSKIKSVVKDQNIEVYKSRLAFQRFEVVRQNNRSLW